MSCFKLIPFAPIIDWQVSPEETNQYWLQLAAVPDCVGNEVGSVVVPAGVDLVVGVPETPTQ